MGYPMDVIVDDSRERIETTYMQGTVLVATTGSFRKQRFLVIGENENYLHTIMLRGGIKGAYYGIFKSPANLNMVEVLQ